MKIYYQLTEQDYVDFNLFHMNNSKSLKKSILVQRLIGPLIFIMSCFIAPKITNMPLWYWTSIMVVMSMLWFAFYPKQIERRCKKQVLKMLSEGQNRSLLAKGTLLVDEKGIIKSNEYGESNLKWNTINKIEVTNRHIFIYQNAISAIVVPLSSFGTKEEKEQFIALLKSYCTTI
ncbi:YcxB family protein [Lutibacter sp. B2]|nr:YcxB family protein [Lutibacter sp. B2]